MRHSILIPALVGGAFKVAADCSRDFLKSITSSYVSAQTSGTASAFFASLASPNTTYTENNIPLSPSNSTTLSSAIKLDFSRSIHDTVQCATFTELIAASDPHPYVIHTRIVLADPPTGPAEQPRASLIESVVTDAGDWLFNATGTLTLVQQEDWPVIPEDKRESRAAIQSLGDAYFDRFGNVSVVVPWGPPCIRVEGGLPARGTLKGEDCIIEWPSTIHVPYRRYVVDEEMGAVDMFIGFPGLDRTQGQNPMPDSHFFRVEGGKIKFLHTASSCVVEGCGLNGTFGRRSLERRW